MTNDAISMNNPRMGEIANGRNGEGPDWWGEAPERLGTSSKEISAKLLEDAVRPKSAPSRNLARITARRVFGPNASIVVPISRPCSNLQSFGSLAPPGLSPIRPFAASPP